MTTPGNADRCACPQRCCELPCRGLCSCQCHAQENAEPLGPCVSCGGKGGPSVASRTVGSLCRFCCDVYDGNADIPTRADKIAARIDPAAVDDWLTTSQGNAETHTDCNGFLCAFVAPESTVRCCEHPVSDHDQHGCTVDVSTNSRVYERCHETRQSADGERP